jgi:hypothetical protein
MALQGKLCGSRGQRRQAVWEQGGSQRISRGHSAGWVTRVRWSSPTFSATADPPTALARRLLKPKAATLLVGTLRQRFPNTVIHVHTHDSAGAACRCRAVRRGRLCGAAKVPSCVGGLHSWPLHAAQQGLFRVFGFSSC